jgi:hypothetical protein
MKYSRKVSKALSLNRLQSSIQPETSIIYKRNLSVPYNTVHTSQAQSAFRGSAFLTFRNWGKALWSIRGSLRSLRLIKTVLYSVVHLDWSNWLGFAVTSN